MNARKLDETTAALLASLTAAAILSRDPGAHLFGEISLLQRRPTVEGELAERERYLDRLHANLEADPSPRKPVCISLFPSHGTEQIVFRLDSLKKRKKRTPSERERRRLLGIQLADFLTAGGL